MCDASLAALERLLMTPRHKFGPSHEWLANWNFPPPKAWAEAQRLAAERSNQNCADSALVLAQSSKRRFGWAGRGHVDARRRLVWVRGRAAPRNDGPPRTPRSKRRFGWVLPNKAGGTSLLFVCPY